VPGDILDDMAKNYFLHALTDYDFKVKVACCNLHNVCEALTHALGLEALLSRDPNKEVKRHKADKNRYVRQIEDRREVTANILKSNWNSHKGGARSCFVSLVIKERCAKKYEHFITPAVMSNASEFQEPSYAYNVSEPIPMSVLLNMPINAPVAPVMFSVPVYSCSMPGNQEKIYANNVQPYATNNRPFVGNINMAGANDNYQNRSLKNSNRNGKRGRNGGRGQLR
jgi:hypothetical protein